MFEACMNKTKAEAMFLVDKLGVKLTSEDKELEGKQLLKVRLVKDNS